MSGCAFLLDLLLFLVAGFLATCLDVDGLLIKSLAAVPFEVLGSFEAFLLPLADRLLKNFRLSSATSATFFFLLDDSPISSCLPCISLLINSLKKIEKRLTM